MDVSSSSASQTILQLSPTSHTGSLSLDQQQRTPNASQASSRMPTSIHEGGTQLCRSQNRSFTLHDALCYHRPSRHSRRKSPMLPLTCDVTPVSSGFDEPLGGPSSAPQASSSSDSELSGYRWSAAVDRRTSVRRGFNSRLNSQNNAYLPHCTSNTAWSSARRSSVGEIRAPTSARAALPASASSCSLSSNCLSADMCRSRYRLSSSISFSADGRCDRHLRDVDNLSQLNIPFTYDEVVYSTNEEFRSLVASVDLSSEQVCFRRKCLLFYSCNSHHCNMNFVSRKLD